MSSGTSAAGTPLGGLRFSLAGAGRVGTSLALWLAGRGAVAVEIAGRSRGGATGALARRLGARPVELGRLASAAQDLLLLAVADPALAGVVRELARRGQAQVALHVSGALDAEVLAPLREAGSAVGSLHPLRAFAEPLEELERAHGTLYAIDGDPAARRLAARLARAFGGDSVEVPGRDRVLYHLAATLAAGGVATLLAAAAELARALGLPPRVLAGYLDLARGALDQVERAGDPAAAITGPAARGDEAVVARHLEALERVRPELRPLVVALVRETRRQVARRGSSERPPAAGEDPADRR